MNAIPFLFFSSIAVIACFALATEVPPVSARLVSAVSFSQEATQRLIRLTRSIRAGNGLVSWIREARRILGHLQSRIARPSENQGTQMPGDRPELQEDPEWAAKLKNMVAAQQDLSGAQKSPTESRTVTHLTPPSETRAAPEPPVLIPPEQTRPEPERSAPAQQPDRSAPPPDHEEKSSASVMESESGRDVSARLADISRFNEDEAAAPSPEAPIDDRIPSSLIVFLHVTGGAGATTFAVNTACSLVKPRRSCCLIDLDVQFGGVASLMDLLPGQAMQALMEDPRRLERVSLESMLVRHPSGVHVLTAPRVPIPLHGLRAAAISDLIRIAKSRFTYVVVDMPVALTTWTDAVLRPAQCVYLVTPLNVQAAHRTARLLHLMKRQELADLPLKIIANRHNSAGGSMIGPKQFAKAVGREIDHLIPNDYEMILQSHNQGMPIVRLAPKAKFSQALVKMLSQDLNEIALSQPQNRLTGFDRI